MPKPFGRLKQSGDIHLPDVEEDIRARDSDEDLSSGTTMRPRAQRAAAGPGRSATPRADGGRAGRQERPSAPPERSDAANAERATPAPRRRERA